MELVVVGSSDAFNSGGRGHSCYWLEDAPAAPFMVDFGATAPCGLNALGLDPGRLAAVLLTHLHGDHFGGFPYFHVDQTFLRPRSEDLLVAGPPGARERVEALLEVAYGSDMTSRASFRYRWRELAPGESLDIGPASVEVFEADHVDPPETALCFRVTAGDGTVIAFSGDTAPCDGLMAAADGADLLVAECTALAPPAGRHVTWQDWRSLLPRLGARRVLLTHLGAPVREALGAGRADAELPDGSPPVELADDGLRLEVGPGGT